MTKRYFSFICKKVFAFICEKFWRAYFSYSFPQSKHSWFISVFQIKYWIIILEVVRALMACFCKVLFLASKRKLVKVCACQWRSYWSCLNYKHPTLKAFIFTELLSYIISLSTCQVHINLNHAFPPFSLVILPKHELKIQIINI